MVQSGHLNKVDNAIVQLESDQTTCKLDKHVQHLLHLICDLKNMESILEDFGYDTKMVPLDKISKSQIKSGFAALNRIERHILDNNFNAEYQKVINAFYTIIPHNFGAQILPLIKTLDELRKEINLVVMLSQVEFFMKSLEEIEKSDKNIHPLDQIYEKLNCIIRPLEVNDPIVELITYYINTNYGPTHDKFHMEIKNIFELDKFGENERFNRDLGNRILLWHSARISNWFEILSNGLKVVPKEAPVTGYMFGHGAYFSDMSSKSAKYAYPQPEKPGFLLLSEVALGTTNDLLDADYDGAKLPKGKNSVRGLGEIGPDSTDFRTLTDGCVIPCGKPIEQKENKERNCALTYNEYVVYDERQIRMRYLVEVEFLFTV